MQSLVSHLAGLNFEQGILERLRGLRAKDLLTQGLAEYNTTLRSMCSIQIVSKLYTQNMALPEDNDLKIQIFTKQELFCIMRFIIIIIYNI